MTQTREAATFGPVTRSAPRRRRRVRRVLVGAAMTLGLGSAGVLHYVEDDTRRNYLSVQGWPVSGQAAVQLGTIPPAASPKQTPVPIASLAKVMTAVVVLAHKPLDAFSDGPAFVVTDQDVAETEMRRARDESVVPVAAGERLTERAALMALLLPSANNVAVMLARWVSGDVDTFVGEMNRVAERLGMTDTVYTDPSGYDAGTVSTAADQLVLARAAAANPTLAAIMATRSYDLPVAGPVQNTNALLGKHGFAGMKTGSHDAAGGCFMFVTHRSVEGVNVRLVGVVLGQRGSDLRTAALYAAKQLADRVAPAPAVPADLAA